MAATASKAIKIGYAGNVSSVRESLNRNIDRGQGDAENAEEGKRHHVGLAAEPAEHQCQHASGTEFQDQRRTQAPAALPAPDGQRRRAGALQRGHAVRSGSPLATDNLKTVLLIAAPASRPTAAPAAAQIAFMPPTVGDASR